jgi:hypothetical protein
MPALPYDAKRQSWGSCDGRTAANDSDSKRSAAGVDVPRANLPFGPRRGRAGWHCSENRQRAAGTRRVHQREYARSPAGTAGAPQTADLQDKRVRE